MALYPSPIGGEFMTGNCQLPRCGVIIRLRMSDHASVLQAWAGEHGNLGLATG